MCLCSTNPGLSHIRNITLLSQSEFVAYLEDSKNRTWKIIEIRIRSSFFKTKPEKQEKNVATL